MHGIHTTPGAQAQEGAGTYTGGDNIFVMIPGKESAGSEPNSVTFFSDIPDDHLPGSHWYHPHMHGSTTVQTFASFGPLVVEKDSAWLPDENGCQQVRDVFESAEEIFMLFSVYPFSYDVPASDVGNLGSEWDLANYQLASEQGNSTYCCDEGTANSTKALEGTGVNSDLVFLSGGYQPVITMRSGEWQHWRIVVASYKDNLIIEIVDRKTQQPAKECEITLVEKDGIFPMEIPRPVSYMSISAGGRADVLARCNAPAGKSFDLVSGRTPSPMGGIVFIDSMTVSQKLATLNVAAGMKEPSLKSKACSPLRPSYAPDLRDAAIKSSDIQVVDDLYPDFTASPSGCSMSDSNFTFPEPNPYKLEIGKVVQWSISRLGAHPLHPHVNPFQLQVLPPPAENTTFEGGWFEAGDYYDTLFIPQANNTFRNVLRFQPGPYPGFAVVHCHYLMHEDGGCMHVINLVCPEGATVEQQMPYTCSQEMPVQGTFETRGVSPNPSPGPSPSPSQNASPASISPSSSQSPEPSPSSSSETRMVSLLVYLWLPLLLLL